MVRVRVRVKVRVRVRITTIVRALLGRPELVWHQLGFVQVRLSV